MSGRDDADMGYSSRYLSSHSESFDKASYSSAEIERFAYWQARTKSARDSSISTPVTAAAIVWPETVINSSLSPTWGNCGISITFLKRIELWSIGYPFASTARTFMFGTLRRTSARIASSLHGGCQR